MTRVQKGQLWSLMDAERPRYTLRVTRIKNGRAFGTLAGGKEYSIAVSVLAGGQRGARLVENADGSLAVPTKKQLQRRGLVPSAPSLEETRTASDYLKEAEPKGVVRASNLQREALALREKGASLLELAKKYGKGTGVISAWLSRAREAREDERNLMECRRAG